MKLLTEFIKISTYFIAFALNLYFFKRFNTLEEQHLCNEDKFLLENSWSRKITYFIFFENFKTNDAPQVKMSWGLWFEILTKITESKVNFEGDNNDGWEEKYIVWKSFKTKEMYASQIFKDKLIDGCKCMFSVAAALENDPFWTSLRLVRMSENVCFELLKRRQIFTAVYYWYQLIKLNMALLNNFSEYMQRCTILWQCTTTDCIIFSW